MAQVLSEESAAALGFGLLDEEEVIIKRPQVYTSGYRRIARICDPSRKDHCNWRNFGDPNWVCPIHGYAVEQPNNLYFGEVIE